MKMKELRAVLAGYLGYTPEVNELRDALGLLNHQDKEEQRSTYRGWVQTGEDRSVENLRRVASWYDGRLDYADTRVNGTDLVIHLLAEFGHLGGGGREGEEEPESARGAVTQLTRSAKKEKTRREPNLRGFGL